MKKTTKSLCLAGVFTALCVIANIFVIDVIPYVFRISAVLTVCFLAGYFLGPLYGFAVGFCGDLLGFLIFPTGGAYNPVIGIATGLLAAIPGLVFWLYKRFSAKKTYVTDSDGGCEAISDNGEAPVDSACEKNSNVRQNSLKTPILLILLSFLIVLLVCTAGLNTFANWWYFSSRSKTFFAYLWARLPYQLINSALNALLSTLLYAALKKVKYFTEFF